MYSKMTNYFHISRFLHVQQTLINIMKTNKISSLIRPKQTNQLPRSTQPNQSSNDY